MNLSDSHLSMVEPDSFHLSSKKNYQLLTGHSVHVDRQFSLRDCRCTHSDHRKLFHDLCPLLQRVFSAENMQKAASESFLCIFPNKARRQSIITVNQLVAFLCLVGQVRLSYDSPKYGASLSTGSR